MYISTNETETVAISVTLLILVGLLLLMIEFSSNSRRLLAAKFASRSIISCVQLTYKSACNVNVIGQFITDDNNV